jgi:hypothetical protein
VYDRLTARYAFPCPGGSEARIRLSAFRSVEQLPGPRRPAVYEVRFACPCGEEHAGLMTQGDLDWAPVGSVAAAFYNLMTGRLEQAGTQLADEAAFRIQHGHWPWTFFCAAEGGRRPAFPSTFRLLLPERGRMVVAVRCPSCSETSVNLVSQNHIDVPFYSDGEVEVAERLVTEREGGVEALAQAVARGSLGYRSESLA